MKDLRPYVCTHESCNEGHQQYDSFKQWANHELISHGVTLTCPEHPTIAFDSLSKYTDHIKQDHSEASLDSGPPLFNVQGLRQCPICLADEVTFAHVSSHLLQIALFPLPSFTGFEEKTDQGSRDSRRAISESRDSEDSKDASLESELLAGTLQMSSSRGDAAAVEQLLLNGADINAVDESYGTALQAATMFGHQALVRKLLEAGADVNAKARNLASALQVASSNGHIQIVQDLLHASADSSDGGQATYNPLQAASRGGYKDVVELLLKYGADVNQSNGSSSALQLASREGHEAVVQSLLAAGADINARDRTSADNEKSMTPIELASVHGHETVVKLLLDNGADLNECQEPSKVLSTALEKGYEGIVALLRDNATVLVSNSRSGGDDGGGGGGGLL